MYSPQQETSPTSMTKIGPIRRLSDPRLEQHLLETLDPEAVRGVSVGNLPEDFGNGRGDSPSTSKIALSLSSQQPAGGDGPIMPQAAMTEDYSSIVAQHDKWLSDVQGRHVAAFDGLLSSIDSLSLKVSDCEAKNAEIVDQIQQLDALIEEERSKWKLRLDAEKSAMQDRVAKLYQGDK